MVTTIAPPLEDKLDLLVRSEDPLNCETSLSSLAGRAVVPNAKFYIRNHFHIPSIDSDRWCLRLVGLVRQPLRLRLSDLLEMPSKTMVVTLECAGNGRSFLSPSVDGEQWGLGAVGTAEWTGVPLAEVLRRAGVDATATEIVLRGADSPASGLSGGQRRFERSLKVTDAQQIPVLLAYAMNGEPLPQAHGFPLRAIVPGRYAVNSVKWLDEIELTRIPFKGYFQTDRYVYEWKRDGDVVTEPVGNLRVRALITSPLDGQTVEAGHLAVSGVAWSGIAPIARVDVTVDDGPWRRARMLDRPSRYGWQKWELTTRVKSGEISIRARATDRLGNTQPVRAEWNRLGYGNNAIQKTTVRAV